MMTGLHVFNDELQELSSVFKWPMLVCGCLYAWRECVAARVSVVVLMFCGFDFVILGYYLLFGPYLAFALHLIQIGVLLRLF